MNLGEPVVEYAIEITWKDWRKAGAKGPTSQYGPFETTELRDHFLATYRRDRDIIGTRVLTRLAAYSPWDGPGEATPLSDEECEANLMKYWEQMQEEIHGPAPQADA